MEHRIRNPKTYGPKCPCGRGKRRKGQSNCLACHREYMKANRPKHSELSPEARKKANCRAYANVYKRRGLLKQEPCKCGSKKSQMHHEDYDKPLEVEWMCRKCHLEEHNENR